MTEVTAETALEPTAPMAPPLSTYNGTASTSYNDLMNTAAVVEGYALADKAQLLGVPFIITGVTFRYGGKVKGGDAYDYVSCEAVTKDDAAIVFNDGSTGIRRQIVQYLIAQGVLGDTDTPDAALTTEDGGAVEFPIRPLRCPRGLRVSEYTNEFTQEGVTYYLG